MHTKILIAYFIISDKTIKVAQLPQRDRESP